MTGIVSHFVGEIKPWVGTTAPSGWLLCQGQAVSRGTIEGTDYYDLWQVLSNGTSSSPFGNGNGTTTFNVPDLRGRMLVGAANTGEVGLTGGAETVTLTAAHLPAHTHTNTVSTTGAHTHSGTTINAHAQHSHTVSWQYSLVGSHAGSSLVTGLAMESSSGSDGTVAVTLSLETVGHSHNFSLASGGDHVHSLISSSAAYNESAVLWTGGSHNNMPPYQIFNFIIKH